MFSFEELDHLTRGAMLEEFDTEQAARPYRSRLLSSLGLAAFAQLMRAALESGNEETLYRSLAQPTYWVASTTYVRAGMPRHRRVNPDSSARSLADTEFNTWYVRGFARRLMSEGVQHCEIYRAAVAWEPRHECLAHEGQVVPVRQVYDGHRARYWPEPGNQEVFSIPFGPNCHHSIRRVKS